MSVQQQVQQMTFVEGIHTFTLDLVRKRACERLYAHTRIQIHLNSREYMHVCVCVFLLAFINYERCRAVVATCHLT